MASYVVTVFHVNVLSLIEMWTLALVILYIAADRANAIYGRLQFTVISGSGMDEADGPHENPEPYAVVWAYEAGGHETRKTTSTKSGTSVTWNEELDFGYGYWEKFSIRVWDEDGGWRGGDDEMSHLYNGDFHPPCPNGDLRFSTGNEEIEYRYCIHKARRSNAI